MDTDNDWILNETIIQILIRLSKLTWLKKILQMNENYSCNLSFYFFYFFNMN